MAKTVKASWYCVSCDEQTNDASKHAALRTHTCGAVVINARLAFGPVLPNINDMIRDACAKGHKRVCADCGGRGFTAQEDEFQDCVTCASLGVTYLGPVAISTFSGEGGVEVDE